MSNCVFFKITSRSQKLVIKFEQVIIRKIIKIVATRCQILRLKCTEIDFGCGSTPDIAQRAYSAPTDPLAEIKGTYTSKGRRGGDGGEGRGMGGVRWGRKARGREWRERPPCVSLNFP